MWSKKQDSYDFFREFTYENFDFRLPKVFQILIFLRYCSKLNDRTYNIINLNDNLQTSYYRIYGVRDRGIMRPLTNSKRKERKKDKTMQKFRDFERQKTYVTDNFVFI